MRASARSGVGATVLVLVVGASGNAQDSTDTLNLTWNAPSTCPTRDDVLGEVAHVLGGTRQDRVPTTARADVVSTDDGRWRAELILDARGAHGERQLEAESCAAIASAAALIVAVSIEGGPPPAPAPAPGPTPRAAPPTAVQREDEPLPRRRDDSSGTWRLIATAAGLIDDGLMPNAPAPGVEATLGPSLDTATWSFRVPVGLSTFPTESTAATGGGAGESGRFSLLAVSARACAWKARGRLAVGPCLGGELDRMNASGAGPAGAFQPGSAHVVWGAALGAVVASFRLSSSVAIFARGEGVAALVRTRFILTPTNVVVHEPSSFAARAALGLELRIF